MLRFGFRFAVIGVLLMMAGTSMGGRIRVPEDYLEINEAIDNATDGDTINVWGFGVPPFLYVENIDFGQSGHNTTS